jgi:hypothetical protein
VELYRSKTSSMSTLNVAVRSATEPAGLTTAATAIVGAIDADLPLYNVGTMGERVEESLARRRFVMLLLTLFAA